MELSKGEWELARQDLRAPHRMDCWTSPTSLGDWDENVHKLSPQSSHLFTFLVTGPLLSGTLINYQWTIVVTFLLEAFSTTSTMVNCQWFANTAFCCTAFVASLFNLCLELVNGDDDNDDSHYYPRWIEGHLRFRPVSMYRHTHFSPTDALDTS